MTMIVISWMSFVTCSFGSTCVQSSDGLSAKCMCPLSCDDKPNQMVCGSDGKDYRNECELHQQACKNQKNIRVQFHGPCGESCPLLPFLLVSCFLLVGQS
uniref:Kazal-like domain-containing protein n=1 Tax=Poecilia mexicana TaxID=48701 RepID=A0A3B3XRN7_9TELE